MRSPGLASMLFVLLIIGAWPGSGQDAAAPNPIGADSLEISLIPEQDPVMLGEPVYLSYVVKNKTNRDFQFPVGGDYRNRLGRPETFTVDVIAVDGTKVQQPTVPEGMGGIVAPEKLPPGGAYTFRLFLPHWATFEKTGRYTISAKRVLRLSEVSKEIVNWADLVGDVVTEAKAEINIVPLDSAKMGMVIQRFGEAMLSKTGSHQQRESTIALATIQDDRAISYFLKALRTNDYEQKFAALNVLGSLNNDSALEGLKEGSKTTGLNIANATTLAGADQLANNIRHAAAGALFRSPHPQALPFLLLQRNDSYYGVRNDVLRALGERVEAKEAIPLLEEMTKDPNEMISSGAKSYLERLKAAKPTNVLPLEQPANPVKD